jgi:pentose-5-phosphate-3-epimerase/broad specificity phosphatase PhoE/putative flippase GtrA
MIKKKLAGWLSEYILFGIVSTLVNFLVFFALIFFGINFLVAGAFGYFTGVFVGVLIKNRFLNNESKINLTKYLMVYVFTFCLYLSILYAFSFFVINIYYANLAAILLASVSNLLGNKYIVFNELILKSRAEFYLYRYKYLLRYIAIGLGSVILESVVVGLIKHFFWIENYFTIAFGFLLGVFLSFYLNSKINFHVPKERNIRTFNVFLSVSFFSMILNVLLMKYVFSDFLLDYGVMRLITSALVFMVSYGLHRRFTFVYMKEVGVAIYLKKNEDIHKIWERVGFYLDFIHIDMVDATYNKSSEQIDFGKGYEIKNTWPGIKTMTHVMSKFPSKYIELVKPFSDIIIVHTEIEEDILRVILKIKKARRKAGISILPTTKISQIIPLLDKVSVVQVLGIKKPGVSGQSLEKDALQKLSKLKELKEKFDFDICFDGGIKLENIDRIDARYVVSASSVLNSENPGNAIFDLKTSSRYFMKEKSLKEEIKKRVLGVDLPYVQSICLVGSYPEKSIMEMSDIDIVIIIDTLTKEKYLELIRIYDEIKTRIETDYGIKLKINDSFGPLKFNDRFDIVFHLMIYDAAGHLEHCIKSPFTVLDWEKTKLFSKKHMASIVKTFTPMPNQLIDNRRGISSYTKDIKDRKITYRRYLVSGKSLMQETLSQKMSEKDTVEYAYHIMKFTMLNFMKIYKSENLDYSDQMIKEFFEITGLEKRYIDFYENIKKQKQLQRFNLKEKDAIVLSSFLSKLNEFMEKFYQEDSKRVVFIRHAKPVAEENIFLGQKMDVGIAHLDESKKKSILELGNFDKAYSSPMKRAIETAKLISKKDIKIELNDNLTEIDYGNAEGKDILWLKKEHKDIINQWDKKVDCPFPNGENYASVIKRLEKFLGLLEKEKNNSCAVMTHNVVLRCLLGIHLGIEPHLWYKIKIGYLESFEAVIPKNKKIYLVLSPTQIENIYRCVYG